MASGATTVLMLQPMNGDILPQMLAGAQRVAEAHRWDFYPVVCTLDAAGAVRFQRSPGGGSLAELLALLRPHGIIIAIDAVPETALAEALREARLPAPPPVVHLGEKDADPRARVCAHGDSDSFAALAVRELLPSGFADFAYAPHRENISWSRARGRAFERLATLAGRRFHAFPDDAPPTVALADRFLPWIRALPKPCAVFAANDISGEAVLLVCERLRLDVPADIAVVGVDDLAYVCDHTHPTLSSVRRDLDGEGRAAAELLAEWLEHPQRPPRSRGVPALSLVRRDSSRFAWNRDRRVARAQEWIRLHACDGARPPDVVRQMGLSRASADRLFRAVAGHTILDEIHAVRIDRAKSRLKLGAPADLVAAECGYASTLDFRRVFRRLVGTPVGAWVRMS